MLRIVVAMCTYRGEQYLDEQLRSIAAQTRPPDGMVIVDDDSRDGTVAMARSFAARAPFPVQVVENPENVGFIRNFGNAIRLANGDVVVLADQDDVWLDSKLEAIEEAFREQPDAAAVFSDAELVDRALRPLGARLSEAVAFSPDQQRLAREGRMFEVLLRGNVVAGATLAFRSEYRELLLPLSDEVEHDAWIALLLSAVAPVSYIARPLILYRQHGGNQIGAGRLSLPERVRRARRQRVEGLGRQRTRNLQVLERLSRIPLSAEKADLLQQAIDHLEVRSGLSERRTERVVPVLREIATGRYRQMSRGLVSACRDLLA
jgi:glycosyltransferase involved in cell wall biosynthesis